MRFVWKGFGTPAPVAPPIKLVVTGFYRRVRNPIYVGLVATVIGEALILDDERMLVYAGVLWLFFHIWVLAIEEPTLVSSFGDEWATFKANVPRWLPRLPGISCLPFHPTSGSLNSVLCPGNAS